MKSFYIRARACGCARVCFLKPFRKENVRFVMLARTQNFGAHALTSVLILFKTHVGQETSWPWKDDDPTELQEANYCVVFI